MLVDDKTQTGKMLTADTSQKLKEVFSYTLADTKKTPHLILPNAPRHTNTGC